MGDLAHATEYDNDLHGDADATHWAERFRVRVLQYPGLATDDGALTAWFAGAIETGRMAGAQVPALEVVIRRVLQDLGHNYGPVYVARLAAELCEATPILDQVAADLAAEPGPGVAGP